MIQTLLSILFHYSFLCSFPLKISDLCFLCHLLSFHYTSFFLPYLLFFQFLPFILLPPSQQNNLPAKLLRRFTYLVHLWQIDENCFRLHVRLYIQNIFQVKYLNRDVQKISLREVKDNLLVQTNLDQRKTRRLTN